MKRSKMSLMPWVGGAVSLVFATTAMAAQPLVDAAWVKDHSCDPNVRVLDIRNKWDGSRKGDYQKGHIPCAIYSDYSSAGWRAKVDNTPGQMSPVAKLEELIGGLGISNDNHVVIYSRGTNALDMGSATRVYWTFKALGHDEVSILNGGYFGYTADEKNPVEKGTHRVCPRNLPRTCSKT
ncbi:MAG: sulfurtransferase [Arenicellales bacterium]